MGVHWCDTPDMHVFCVFCCASVSVRFGLHGVACASCGRARHRRLTVLHIGEAVHERQPHQTLRGRVPHQRIQEDVEGHLFLSTHRQGYIRITVQSKKQTIKNTHISMHIHYGTFWGFSQFTLQTLTCCAKQVLVACSV